MGEEIAILLLRLSSSTKAAFYLQWTANEFNTIHATLFSKL
jgi:hypothetical protein